MYCGTWISYTARKNDIYCFTFVERSSVGAAGYTVLYVYGYPYQSQIAF